MHQTPDSSVEDKAQDLVYDAWDAARITEAKKLAKQALLLDPYCTDAFNVLASYEKNIEKRSSFYRQAIETFKQRFDKKFFKENAGFFWGLFETRPYMRALAGYGEVLLMQDDNAAAIDVFQEALKLCPDDNLGLRYPLLNCLLIENDLKSASKLIKEYDENSAFMAYSKLLLSIKNQDTDECLATRFRDSLTANTYIVPYLLGIAKFPQSLPEYYQLGSKEEAVTYVLLDGYKVWALDGFALVKLRELQAQSISPKE